MHTVKQYRDNFLTLKEYQPGLTDWLEQSNLEKESLADLLVPKDNLLDLKLPGGGNMFDHIDPRIFYSAWIQNPIKKLCATLLIGTNLGYGLNFLLEQYPEHHRIIVIEPEARQLALCLSHSDYQKYIKSGRLTFLPPDRQLLNAKLRQWDVRYLFGNIHMHLDTPSTQIGPQYALWGRYAREALDGLRVEVSTLRSFQETMIEQELTTFQSEELFKSSLALQNMGKNLNAMVIGAGPSLDRLAPHLAKLKDRCLLTTAFQNLPAMQRLGIKPHFCMAIDIHDHLGLAYNKIDRDWCADIPFLFSANIHPDVIARYPGPKRAVWTQGGIAESLFDSREPFLHPGGNVSLSLVRILRFLNVKKCFFAGVDLAWDQEGTTHSDGHHAFKPAPEFNPKKHRYVPGSDGKQLVTSVQYLHALRELEAEIKSAPQQFFNIYGGGALINGAQNISWERAVEEGVAEADSDRIRTILDTISKDKSKPVLQPEFLKTGQEWLVRTRQAGREMDKLIKKRKLKAENIASFTARLLVHVREKTFYRPSMLNEAWEIKAMHEGPSSFDRPETIKLRQLLKKITAKAARIDRIVKKRE